MAKYGKRNILIRKIALQNVILRNDSLYKINKHAKMQTRIYGDMMCRLRVLFHKAEYKFHCYVCRPAINRKK